MLDATFSALADPTRRLILQRLSTGEAAVSDVAGLFDMSLPAVMKHLGVLERAGLVRSIKEGRVRRARIEAAPMRSAIQWLETYRIFWESNLDSLAAFLEAESASDTEKPKSKTKPQKSKKTK